MPDRTFPRGDDEFLEAISLFLEYVNVNQSLLPINSGKVSALKAVRDEFRADLQEQRIKNAEKQAATHTKNAARKRAENLFNKTAQNFKVNEDVTNTQLVGLNLTVRDRISTPVGVPTTRPIGRIDTNQRLRHLVHFIDQTSVTTGRRAKPRGVRGCQIWVKIGGESPMNTDDCGFLQESSATPYTVVHKSENAGTTAYYILRWVNRKGEAGPLSEVVSATITG